MSAGEELRREVELEDFFSKIISSIGKTTEEELAAALKKAQLTVAVAESLTGGLISSHLTRVAGSSQYFLGGIVCYSTIAKVAAVGVPGQLIAKNGEVSREVALAMAEGIRKRFRADIGISATGVAGPALVGKAPIGKTFVALSTERGSIFKELNLKGSRHEIRAKAAQGALGLLWLHLGGDEITLMRDRAGEK